MRMRKKKNGAKRIEALGYLLIPTEETTAVSPNVFFDQEKPVSLEIGCGKGSFILGMAKRYPEHNFIAVERVSDVILSAMEGVAAEELGNVRFLIGNAQSLPQHFLPHSFRRIYLNFSDPWPKAGHAKRRLTHANFLSLYQDLLTPDGHIAFKTDNRPLFDFSIEQFTECGWRIEEVTNDLHHSQWNEGNIETEYERNFSAKGFTINRLVAYPIRKQTTASPTQR